MVEISELLRRLPETLDLLENYIRIYNNPFVYIKKYYEIVCKWSSSNWEENVEDPQKVRVIPNRLCVVRASIQEPNEISIC
jgi:hypothetical protein